MWCVASIAETSEPDVLFLARPLHVLFTRNNCADQNIQNFSEYTGRCLFCKINPDYPFNILQCPPKSIEVVVGFCLFGGINMEA